MSWQQYAALARRLDAIRRGETDQRSVETDKAFNDLVKQLAEPEEPDLEPGIGAAGMGT